MTLIRTVSEDIVVDCGMLFPYEECFDINYLIPDFSDLDASRIKSIIITHGHEDHIGALGHFIRKFPDVTVYASRFTLHLIQKKLEEFNVKFKFKFKFKLYHSQDELKFEDVDIFPVHVNHSIPETCGLIIRSKDKDKSWGALYISDFKVDLTSSHEAPIDLARIKSKLSECKKTAYFLDSTNIIADGKTTSENELHADLKNLIDRPHDRLFITLFASNIHRLDLITRLAKDSDRKIIIMGRSLKAYIESAIETGHMKLSADDFYAPEQVKGETGKMLVLLSGCQGDFLSALRRFSFGEDGTFKPRPGDLVVFSSKVIPGNEKKIYRIYNKLVEFGAEVVTANDFLIHASGHPGKEDMHIMLQNFQPDFYFPIHGESYMLKKHQEFIQQCYPQTSCHLIYNHHEVIFGNENIKFDRHDSRPPILIHGKALEIEKTQISQRRKMATQGTVFISYLKNQEVLQITTLGLPLYAETLLENLKKKLQNQIEKDLKNRDENYFKDQIKISTRQYFNNFLGYKPVTEVHLY